MSTPFSIQGTLSLPGVAGLPFDPIPFAIISAYDSKEVHEYNLPAGPGTKTVDFGTLPSAGIKAYLLIYVAVPGGAPSILLTRNSGTAPEEISNGGWVAGANPSPSAGITAMSIAYTGAGKVQVWLLG